MRQQVLIPQEQKMEGMGNGRLSHATINPITENATLAKAHAAPTLNNDFSQLPLHGAHTAQRATACSLAPTRCPFGGACHTCPVQAKLTIGQPNDKYEQEADRIAEQVMNMPDPRIQRQDVTGEEEETAVQPKPLADQITPLLQRAEDTKANLNPTTSTCFEHEFTQMPIYAKEQLNSNRTRNYNSSDNEAPPIVHEVLDSPGHSLDSNARATFEERLDHDFSRVKVHTGEKAAASADAVNSLAYTVGNHVVLGSGYNSSDHEGSNHLLAHELVHVMQWGDKPIPTRLFIGSNTGLPERQAQASSIQRDSKNMKIPESRLAKTTLLQREQTLTQERSSIRWGNISRLANGMVLRVEVRTGGGIEDITHEYPIDVNGYIKMPPLGLVRAIGLSTDQLADHIQRVLINGGFIRNPTVNVTLTRKIVAYGALITYPSVHLRLLSRGGRVESGSGEYPVRSDGKINLPHIGVIPARNRRLDVVESDIESRIRQGYIRNGIAHLTRQHLD